MASRKQVRKVLPRMALKGVVGAVTHVRGDDATRTRGRRSSARAGSRESRVCSEHCSAA